MAPGLAVVRRGRNAGADLQALPIVLGRPGRRGRRQRSDTRVTVPKGEPSGGPRGTRT